MGAHNSVGIDDVFGGRVCGMERSKGQGQNHECSELSHELLFYPPMLGGLATGDAERTNDRRQSWGQVCWALRWRCITALLLPFSFNSSFTLLLFSYSLKPCFSIL
jgi:hypothetical protein